MKLPKICPGCGIDIEQDAMYYVLGIQYCNGMATDDNLNFDRDEKSIEIDLDGAGSDWTVDPYEVSCSECEYVLWSKFIIVNEEKFFVEGKI